ncbi:MAG: RHS repeat domain-containing protein, partial [Bacilli bacterium]
KSCADGQNYQYVYNDKDILIGIKDNFGNDVSFDYQKDGVIKEIKSNDQIIRTVEYKDEDGCFTKIDELENVTKTIKDEFGNVISYIDGKGNIIRRVFNAQQKPIEIERYNQEEKPINASIKYNRFNKVEEILCSNGSKINIEYHEFGNQILEKINDAPLAYYRYIEPYNSLVNLYSFISNNETPKGVEYDSKGKIKSVYSGNDKIPNLKYDDTGKLVEMKNISWVEDQYFNYDSNGKLISITDSYDNKISYDLDNLGNVEKETIKLFDSRMASSFIMIISLMKLIEPHSLIDYLEHIKMKLL